METTYDSGADAGYVYFKRSPVRRSVAVSDYVVVDLDENGKLLGVELLGLSRQVDPDVLKTVVSRDITDPPRPTVGTQD